MKKFIPLVAVLLCAGVYLPKCVKSQPITQPRSASPAAVVSQTIGISNITVHYSRPAVRDREIWGALVPYGWNVQGFGAGNEAPWRSGANENTTITFSHDATVAGKSVPAGTYGLFYVIHEDNTGEVILSTDHQAWGSFWYDPANDVLRAGIELEDIPHTERLTYQFVDIDRTSATLVLDWEQKRFPVSVSVDVDEIVFANATEELKGVTGFSWQGYNSAATYCLNNNVHLDQALVWADKAVAQNPSFTTINTKARILEAQGKSAESVKLVEKAMSAATEAELNIYGYQLLNQGKNDEAIKVFTTNTKRFPKSANAWDSLGEAYFLSGKKKESVQYFKKSLGLNPPDNVRLNSEKYLKQVEG